MPRDWAETKVSFKNAPLRNLAHGLHPLSRNCANPPQFLIGKVGLFLVAGTFYVAQSQFVRDALEFRLRHAEQEGSSCPRNKFRHLIIHGLPLYRTMAKAPASTDIFRLVNLGVYALRILTSPLAGVGPPPCQCCSLVGMVEVGACARRRPLLLVAR